MSKRIVALSDGTWNDGAESATNIHWLDQMLARDSGQIVHYDRGVGTDWYNRRTGGAFGVGLSRNIRQLYGKIRHDYQRGDDIFVFGFSRGAFTARSLCGFMGRVGHLANAEDIDEAYLYYRGVAPAMARDGHGRDLKPAASAPMPVRFLGVFDTVGALGVPVEIDDDNEALAGSLLGSMPQKLRRWIDRLGDHLRRPIKGFHDTQLGDQVEQACHALAIDERRKSFLPTMWTKAPGEARKLAADGEAIRVPQTVRQAWFAGVHCDVGGGYADLPREHRLANLPLLWMAEQAAAAGLRFKPGALEQLRQWTPSLATAPQHDSRSGIWAKLPELVRPIGNEARRRCDPSGDDCPLVEVDEWIHGSVQARLGQDVEVRPADRPERISRMAYLPANLVPEMIRP